MDERDACQLLRAHDRARRTRYFLGALRLLARSGESKVRRWGLSSPGGLEIIQRDLHLAGVPWPSSGEQGEAAGGSHPPARGEMEGERSAPSMPAGLGRDHPPGARDPLG